MFKTDRLTFSIITHEDQADVFETLNSEHTATIISLFEWPMTEKQAQSWCDAAVKGSQDKTGYLFITRENSAPVGCIGVHLDAENAEKAEIGYWVTEKFQKQGFGSEMLTGVIKFCAETLNLEELLATTTLNNPASENLLIKSGFEYTGEKDVLLLSGITRPSKCFLLRL